jgi:FkbM family methyltransferase
MKLLQDLRNAINSIRVNYISKKRKNALAKELDHSKLSHFTVSATCPHEWYGGSYGGFFINPDLLSSQSIVYSIGIGKDISFDLACIRKHGCKVYGFDPTPKSIGFIRGKNLPASFQFFDYGITAGESGEAEFFLPDNPNGTSGSMIQSDGISLHSIKVKMKSFADIAAEMGHRHVDVLKMDIEGSEYEVLESILNSKVTVDQILVEFHDRMFDQEVYRSKATVQKMRARGYRIFAHSTTFEEISFIHERKLS